MRFNLKVIHKSGERYNYIIGAQTAIEAVYFAEQTIDGFVEDNTLLSISLEDDDSREFLRGVEYMETELRHDFSFGDVITADVVDHIIDTIWPETQTKDLVQMGEVYKSINGVPYYITCAKLGHFWYWADIQPKGFPERMQA